MNDDTNSTDTTKKHTSAKPRSITAEELDEMFDNGEDISEYLDYSKAMRVRDLPKRINVDLSWWMVHALDQQASKIGVPRQALIKMWLADRLEQIERTTT